MVPVTNYNGHILHSASNLDGYNWTFPGDLNAASSLNPPDSSINNTSPSSEQMCFVVGSQSNDEKQMDQCRNLSA